MLPISTKWTITSHLNSLDIKKDHDIHDIWNPDPCLEHLQQCGRIKIGDGISTLPLLIICIYWEKEEKVFVNLMSSSDRDGHLVFQISIKITSLVEYYLWKNVSEKLHIFPMLSKVQPAQWLPTLIFDQTDRVSF